MMFALLFVVSAACVPIHDPVLRARDLAAADERFSVVDQNAPAGYAPVPGARRVVSQGEMERLARRFGIETPVHEACFEWAMRKIEADAVKQAMTEALGGDQITVTELPNFEVPDGKFVFSTASLPKSLPGRPAEPVTWRGAIEYAPGRRFPIWAKVKIDRSGNNGEVLVARGDEVKVAVHSGAAMIKISARAESGGALGQSVRFRNTKSGKVFEARVTGKATANMTVPAGEEGQ